MKWLLSWKWIFRMNYFSRSSKETYIISLRNLGITTTSQCFILSEVIHFIVFKDLIYKRWASVGLPKNPISALPQPATSLVSDAVQSASSPGATSAPAESPKLKISIQTKSTRPTMQKENSTLGKEKRVLFSQKGTWMRRTSKLRMRTIFARGGCGREGKRREKKGSKGWSKRPRLTIL